MRQVHNRRVVLDMRLSRKSALASWTGSIIEKVDHTRGLQRRAAGIYLIKPLAEMTVEELEEILATNARGVFLGMNHFAPFMD